MGVRRFFIEGIDFIKQINHNRYLIYELTKRDFKGHYVSNILGLSWAILEPLLMMLILLLVFTYLRNGKQMEYPFGVYLITGLIAFEFFSKTLNQATKSIRTFDFLVKKVNFRVAIIPLVKIFSEIFMHVIIIFIVIIILFFNKIWPSIYWLQLFYYIFATSMLLLGISWITSSIQLFFPDISTIVNLATRVLFFLTPIFWEINIFPDKVAKIMRLNPLFYIVSGYRDSFLYHIPFWDKPLITVYFWGLTFFILLVGILVFKRLRPHFADVI